MAVVGLTGLAGLVAALVAHHALTPELSVRDHTVSEYANAPLGWLMTLGFLAWAVSLAAAARALGYLRGHGAAWVRALLALAALGLALTAAFKTQTSADVLPPGVERSAAGRLHDWGSGVALLALFAAAGISTRLTQLSEPVRRVISWLLVGGLALHLGLLAAGDPAPGLRQRALLLLGISWQAALLALAYRASRASSASR